MAAIVSMLGNGIDRWGVYQRLGWEIDDRIYLSLSSWNEIWGRNFAQLRPYCFNLGVFVLDRLWRLVVKLISFDGSGQKVCLLLNKESNLFFLIQGSLKSFLLRTGPQKISAVNCLSSPKGPFPPFILVPASMQTVSISLVFSLFVQKYKYWLFYRHLERMLSTW